ncbi:hypothetical protein F5Y19DRAFT_491852 [Xylariaceae sp. FL1651]|nr:hypothetical protein F5Y19DRAFT_491852 [Xylariaceae sp. FL1651]
MESRGNAPNERSHRKPAIPRRSCDQCRARKVGCDRGSPCANCVSTKLDCTFSVVAPKATSAKQRVLISAQYEQKIDEIAESVGAIKLLLSSSQTWPGTDNTLHISQGSSVQTRIANKNIGTISKDPVQWDHSAQVSDFVRTIAEDRASREIFQTGESDVLTALKGLARALDGSNIVRDLSFPETRDVKRQDDLPMPPAEAAVLVLRWARAHEVYFRIESVCRILPLENFTNICRKVYFAVDQYSEVDFILANGYLSYVFSEYIATTGQHGYQDYCKRCRQNAQVALSRLNLLLPASIEVIAALTFGASYAVECSKATLAWTFISNAADLCQTLGLHRLGYPNEIGDSEGAQSNLFWMVYLLEKSLSLRLNRPSNIRDAEITTTLSSNPSLRRCSKVSRIQGKVYDQLYGPVGLAKSDVERGNAAVALALELRNIISEVKTECYTPVVQNESERDTMRVIYHKIELVKQLSLLAFILRAIPAPPGSATSITDECAAAAHEALEMHQQCMVAVEACKNDRFMVTRYINWGILHMPFVPFSILFTRIVQLSDATDLHYLDRFTESLQSEQPSAESITHPYRLYKLLCKAARLYIEQDAPSLLINETGDDDTTDPWSVFDFASLGTEMNSGPNDTELGIFPPHGLSEWFYGNQQLMGLLDDDVMF